MLERGQVDPCSHTRGTLETVSKKYLVIVRFLPPCLSVKPSESHWYVSS